LQLRKQRRRGFGAHGLLYRLATLPGERHAATRRVRHNSPAPGDISIHLGLQGLGQYPPGTSRTISSTSDDEPAASRSFQLSSRTTVSIGLCLPGRRASAGLA
jgi:hypothetical protein